jgi:hypothetical protein
MRYFNRAQRTVKKKLVLFQGFLVGRNARIKLFGELDLALANVISLQDV